MTNETISADWEDRPYKPNPYIELVKRFRFIFVYGQLGWTIYADDPQEELKSSLGYGHYYSFNTKVLSRTQWEVHQEVEGLSVVNSVAEQLIEAYKSYHPATPSSNEAWGGFEKLYRGEELWTYRMANLKRDLANGPHRNPR